MRLPGGDLVDQGIRDLRARRETLEALLVSIGSPRVRTLGIDVPTPFAHPEHRLYATLAADDAEAAHARCYERAAAVASS